MGRAGNRVEQRHNMARIALQGERTVAAKLPHLINHGQIVLDKLPSVHQSVVSKPLPRFEFDGTFELFGGLLNLAQTLEGPAEQRDWNCAAWR